MEKSHFQWTNFWGAGQFQCIFVESRCVFTESSVGQFDRDGIARAIFWTCPRQTGQPIHILETLKKWQRSFHIMYM